MKTYVHLLYLAEFFWGWEMFKIEHKMYVLIETFNQNTHFMFNNFFPESRAVYEITWKNIIQPDRPQMTI
jgi:hypothetical protein